MPHGRVRLVTIERFRNKIQKHAGAAASALGGAEVGQAAETRGRIAMVAENERLCIWFRWFGLNYSEFVLLAMGVIGTNMGCKLFVIQLEVAHHLIERCAGRGVSRFEPPATFGATKTPKTRLLNPYQLPSHGRLGRCANENPLAVKRDETFWFATSVPFAAVSWLIAPENRHQAGRNGRS
jgi:hypothetical protein